MIGSVCLSIKLHLTIVSLCFLLVAAGWGMRVVGGKANFDGKLGAFVTQVASGGPADQSGIRKGRKNASRQRQTVQTIYMVRLRL